MADPGGAIGNPVCPACGCGLCRYLFTKVTSHGHYRIYRCRGCRSAFVYPRPEMAEIKAFYQEAYAPPGSWATPQERYDAVMEGERRYPNSTLDAARMAGLCRRYSQGTRLLDVGAGNGFFTKAAIEREFQVQALEPSPANRELFAVMNGFEPDPIMLDKAFADRHQQAWDIVLLSQVLEHIVDPEEMVGFVAGMLKDGAVAAIAVPHFGSLISMIQRRNDMFIIPPEHLNFFTISGLRQLFKHHGFRLLHVETVSRFDRNKLKRRLRMGALGDTLGAALAAILRITDSLRMGMYINAYFRKETTG